MGRISRPDSIARRKPPFLNTPSFPVRVRVPSGKVWKSGNPGYTYRHIPGIPELIARVSTLQE